MNKLDIVAIVFSVAVVIFLVFGFTYVRYSEKKDWNNGICPHCGKPWIHFDTDSQGGRMYRCENWHSCDISYNVDKRKRKGIK